jgi:hypothetical protein
MRVFIVVLVLIFSLQSWTRADDIRDFEIEGMSLGDSLLDYFTEEEILANKPDWFKDNEYSIANDLKLETFQIYELVQAAYKTKDKKYIFEGIEGYKFYKKKDNCLKEFDEVVNDISKLSLNAVKSEKKTFKHPDPTENATVTTLNFEFDSGDSIRIGCTDSPDYNPPIDLRVILRTKEYSYFLNNKAY